jgi:hypothetical protein
VYTYEGEPLSTLDESNQTDNSAPVTTSWLAVRDITVWRTDNKDGKNLCFPKVTANITETKYPDGSNHSTTEGGVLIEILEDEIFADGVTALTKPGLFYQVEGILQTVDDTDDIWTYTKADGTYINVCELLSPTDTDSPVTAPSPAPATKAPTFSAASTGSAVCVVAFLMMLPASAAYLFF